MEPVGRDDIGITDSMYVLVLDNVLFNKCIHVSDKIQYIIKSMYVVCMIGIHYSSCHCGDIVWICIAL